MTTTKTPFSADHLRGVFSYDPETGLFTRLVRGRGRYNTAGIVFGNRNTHGYIRIKIDGHECMAHRLAWLYVHGAWPSQDIDHINGIRHDNRIVNLRDVSRSINEQNQRFSQSASGLLGTSLIKRTGKWKAQIHLNRKQLYLGIFDTCELAHEAYLLAKRAMHAGCTI